MVIAYVLIRCVVIDGGFFVNYFSMIYMPYILQICNLV